MSRRIDLSRPVYELVQKDPDLADVLADLGFAGITKKAMLKSAGRLITLQQGAKIKGLDWEQVRTALLAQGFELSGESAVSDVPREPDTSGESSDPGAAAAGAGCASQALAGSSDPGERQKRLKNYLSRLGEGEDLESVRADFVKHFEQVDATEIMAAEETLMAEGTPLEEVQRLCDLHSALFHGKTESEQDGHSGGHEADGRSGGAAVTAGCGCSGSTSAAGAPGDMASRAAKLVAIPGHPLQTLTAENRALQILLDRAFELLGEGEAQAYDRTPGQTLSEPDSDREQALQDILLQIRPFSIHYAKKGDLLYPLLDVKYGISGPSKVMWSVDVEIRREIGLLCRPTDHEGDRRSRIKAVLQRAKEMIYKEDHIFFPICAQHFSNDDWLGIYRDSKDYECFAGMEPAVWPEGELALKHAASQVSVPPAAPAALKQEYVAVRPASEHMAASGSVSQQAAYFRSPDTVCMPGGSLTLPELTALLNTIPLEITFVDRADVNRYFNEGPKIFKRPLAALGREVFSCHPPKVELMVRGIIDDFKNKRRDLVSVWTERNGKSMLVQYMAVRDAAGHYLGTAEFVQEMDFAKEHFEKKQGAQNGSEAGRKCEG